MSVAPLPCGENCGSAGDKQPHAGLLAGKCESVGRNERGLCRLCLVLVCFFLFFCFFPSPTAAPKLAELGNDVGPLRK